MKYTYSLDINEEIFSVTLLDRGLVMIADPKHPNFKHIVAEIKRFREAGMNPIPETEQAGFRNLFDATYAVAELFELTDRVVLRGDKLFFDGKQIDGVLVDHVLNGVRQGLPKEAYLPYVRFWENVQANPDPHSREHLLRWLMAESFTINTDGFIVGYKGVRDDLKSKTAGPGVVNGVSCNGNLDNSPGNVIEVVRSYVTFDPRQTCSQGLHVGTWGYASTFGPKVVEVWVDPKDVVSVPSDCNGSKMRVCRYEVKRVIDKAYKLAVLSEGSHNYDVPEDNEFPSVWECPNCGEEDDSCVYGCVNVCEECDEYSEDCECRR